MSDPEKYVPVGRLADQTVAKQAGDKITSFIRQSPWPVWDLPNDSDHISFAVNTIETVARQKNMRPH